jgi:starvation-inducible DNA-binding protein
MNKTKLIEQLKVILACTFSYYLKAHNFHWNIEGPDFPQYHSFLETVYTDSWEAVDAIAEKIRMLDAYAPGSLSRFKQLSNIEDQIYIPTSLKMIEELYNDTSILQNEIKSGMKLADEADESSISNFLQERYDAHAKLKWMMRSIIKG